MKLNNRICVAFNCFVLTLLTQAGESVLPRIDSNEPAFHGMDGRVLAIAANPELLAKLDQKNLYQTKEAYQKVLNRSLREISFLMPANVSSGSMSNLVTAFCVCDAKVFFWLPKFDQDLVGWVSLPGRNNTIETKKMLVFWIIPHKDSSKGIQWAKPQEISDSQLVDVINETTGNNLGDLNRIEKGDATRKEISGTMNHQNHTYQIQATLSSKCLQIRMLAIPEDNAHFPGKPVLEDEPLDLTKPIKLPFWPPKEE